MLKLSDLKPYRRSTKRTKVIGRGVGSGHGTFSGRGSKGQKARAGSSIPVGFEGGRMPLQRQIPKRRGFTSHIPKFIAVSFNDLNEKFETHETVNPKILFNKGIIKSAQEKVKILSVGELKKALKFENVSFSAEALKKIEAAGGKLSK